MISLIVLYTLDIYLIQVRIVDRCPLGSSRLATYYLISLPSKASKVTIVVLETLGTELYRILVGEYLRYPIMRVFNELIVLVRTLSHSLLYSFFFSTSFSSLLDTLTILVNLDKLEGL